MVDSSSIINVLCDNEIECLHGNPWHKRLFNDEFILLSEFSEMEGPKPVMTIPEKGGGSFDKNAFAVKVLSVDCNSLGALPGVGLCGFQIVGDTQIVASEVSDTIAYYVYHFTLYDIQARGFVRPFCMAYIKHSKDGIIHELSELNSSFYKTSLSLRLGNAIVFLQKLDERKTYLDALNEKMKDFNTDTIHTHELKNITKQMINEYYQDTNDLIHVFNRYVDDVFNCPDSRNVDDQFLKTLFTLIVDKRIRTPSDEMDYQILLETVSPRSLGITSGRKFDTTLHNLEELCGNGYEIGMTTLQRLVEKSQFTNKRLELLEKSRGIFGPLHGLFGINAFFHKLSQGSGSPCAIPHTLFRVSSFCGSETNRRDSFIRMPSNDSRESLKSPMESYKETVPIISPNSPSPTGGDFEMLQFESTTTAQEQKSLYPPLPYSFQSSNSINLPSTRDPVRWLDSSLFLTETKLTQHVVEQKLKRLDSMSSNCSDFGRNLSSSFGSLPNGSPLDFYLSNPPDRETANIPYQPIPYKIDYKMAQLIIKLMRRYTFMPHLIYSLLIGRTVVLLAEISNEEKVQHIINVLTYFLPDHVGNMKQSVISWISGPLHISLLAKAKLIGLAKSIGPMPTIPASVRCYVSIFDVDDATLSSPPYNGVILHDLFDAKKDWPTIVAFVDYLHCVGLKLCALTFAKFSSLYGLYELGNVDRDDFPSIINNYNMLNINSGSAVQYDLHPHDNQIIKNLICILESLLIHNDSCTKIGLVTSDEYFSTEHCHDSFEVKLNYEKCQLFKSSSNRKR